MTLPTATCETHDHASAAALAATVDRAACERAAGIFRALGDSARLQLLSLLSARELCVSELAAALADSLPAVSQRLKLLRAERIVKQRRDGKHIYYALADAHVTELVLNGLAHARERGL